MSFLAKKQKAENDLKLIPVDGGKFYLYGYSAVYGPNASGKSNIVKAFTDLRNFIIMSQNYDFDDSISVYKPFKLDSTFLEKPSVFEIEFVINNIRYLYKISFTAKEVIREHLGFYPEGRYAKLFHRNRGKSVEYGTYFKGEKKALESFLQPNQLLLSVAGKTALTVLKPVYTYFRDALKIHVIMDSSKNLFFETTDSIKYAAPRYRDLVVKFLKAADFQIQSISMKKDESRIEFLQKIDFASERQKNRLAEKLTTKVELGHLNQMQEEVFFDLQQEESSGTVKMYDMAYEIIYALENGTVLIVDEFTSGLHPSLNKFLVSLFQDSAINRMNAQLLITTHDACILDVPNIRREQIWFTDKNAYHATELFSIAEFDKNKFREGGNFARYYLDGRFGALPRIYYSEFTEGLRYAQKKEKAGDPEV